MTTQNPARSGLLADWLEDWFVPTFVNGGNARFWCTQWHNHAEATLRLEALRIAYMDLVNEPAGLSRWLVEHADRHFEVLFGDRSTFQHCSDSRGCERTRKPEFQF